MTQTTLTRMRMRMAHARTTRRERRDARLRAMRIAHRNALQRAEQAAATWRRHPTKTNEKAMHKAEAWHRKVQARLAEARLAI